MGEWEFQAAFSAHPDRQESDKDSPIGHLSRFRGIPIVRTSAERAQINEGTS